MINQCFPFYQEVVLMPPPDHQALPAGSFFHHQPIPLEMVHNTPGITMPLVQQLPANFLPVSGFSDALMIQAAPGIPSGVSGCFPHNQQRQILTVPSPLRVPQITAGTNAPPNLLTDPTAQLLCPLPQRNLQSEIYQNRHKVLSIQQQHPRSILRAKRRSGGGSDVTVKTFQKNGFPSLLGHPDSRVFESSLAMKRSCEGKEDHTSINQTMPASKRIAYDEEGACCDDVSARDENRGFSLNTPFIVKLTSAVEYYFSDSSLSKNSYLLKQIQQNKDGFISIKRVIGLKRIKALTRDLKLVTECIKQSNILELSSDLSMIRRKDRSLPKHIETPPLVRSIIAINLPITSPTVESVTSLFSRFGDLIQVCVLKPGMDLPVYLNDYKSWVPDLGQEYCALVEFETQESAQNACREINMKNREQKTFRVALLKPGARLRRTLYRKYKGDPDIASSNLLEDVKKELLG